MPAVTTAQPRIPNMWNDWKRNISWMRNQEMASDFISTRPKANPIAT